MDGKDLGFPLLSFGRKGACRKYSGILSKRFKKISRVFKQRDKAFNATTKKLIVEYLAEQGKRLGRFYYNRNLASIRSFINIF